MSTLPPLPKIDGDIDLMLDVYTHSSLSTTSGMNETYGDTLRLEQLGAKVLDFAVTVHLYNEHSPLNTAEEIRASRALNGIQIIMVIDGTLTEQEYSIHIACHHRFLARLLRIEGEASHRSIEKG